MAVGRRPADDLGRILHGIDGIGFHYFTESDVIRHRLVREIVKAYAQDAAGAA